MIEQVRSSEFPLEPIRLIVNDNAPVPSLGANDLHQVRVALKVGFRIQTHLAVDKSVDLPKGMKLGVRAKFRSDVIRVPRFRVFALENLASDLTEHAHYRAFQ